MTDKSKLRQQEREIQKEIHAFIRKGDRDSDDFWRKHDELNKVQVQLYSVKTQNVASQTIQSK